MMTQFSGNSIIAQYFTRVNRTSWGISNSQYGGIVYDGGVTRGAIKVGAKALRVNWCEVTVVREDTGKQMYHSAQLLAESSFRRDASCLQSSQQHS